MNNDNDQQKNFPKCCSTDVVINKYQEEAMKNRLKNLITILSSFALTLLMCMSLPVSTALYASDLEIYQTATVGETRIMFVLDTSASMSYNYSAGSINNMGCDLPSGVTVTSVGNEPSSSSFDGTTIPTYSRYYCNSNQITSQVYNYKAVTSTSQTTRYNCGSNGATTSSQSACNNTGIFTTNPLPSTNCQEENRSASGNTTTITTYYFSRSNNCSNTSSRTYRYRETYTQTTNYYSCPANASSVNACTTAISSAPSGSYSNESCGTNCVAYFTAEYQKYYDRITRLKDGLFDVLLGRNGVTKLKDDLKAGLTDFSGSKSGGYGTTGNVLVPVRLLNATATTTTGCTGNQRNCLLTKIAAMTATDYTPTGNAYAVGAKSLLTTVGNDSSTCNGNGVYVLTDGGPSPSSTINNTQATMATTIPGFTCPAIFNTNPTDPDSTYEFKSKTSTSYDNDQIWKCIAKFNNALLTGASSRPKVKTAIVGFGSFYTGLDEYTGDETNPTQLSPRNIDIQNILNRYPNITNSYANVQGGSSRSDITNTALWGVYGKGGWYSASEPAQVASSILNFVEAAGGEVPAVSTGTATIPVDALYSSQLQPYAYYAQFDPKPGTSDTLWLGNMKKYDVLNGIIGKKTGSGSSATIDSLIDDNQKIKRITDLWAASNVTNTTGSISQQGGMLSKLPVGSLASGTTAEVASSRKIYSNRTVSTTTPVTASANDTVDSDLTSITATSYIDSTDPDKAYLYSLLGYNLQAAQFTDPSTITASLLATTPRFSKVGMIIHSRPVLLTQGGKVVIDASGNSTTTGRQDYALFGSTQGVLHVVEASGVDAGKEKFAFVPHEMITAQKEYFKKDVVQVAGDSNFKYGIDGPWTAYTEYVPTTSGGLTVGTGRVSGLSGKQWVYGGLRMGGKSYYALDLGNLDNPKLKFHINPTGSCSNSNPLGCMGESWSKPHIAWVKWNGARKLVMFVGGGYDRGYESATYDPTRAAGNGVYMFDANNGNLLWWASSSATNRSYQTNDADNATQATNNANLNYSVVSEIKTVDRNADGLIDHLYFGDLGSQAFRVDINNGAASDGFAKRVVRILNLHNGAYGPRFYEKPAFTIHNNPSGNPFGVVSFGSGNRSIPMFPRLPTLTATWATGNENYINDGVYAIFDKDVARTDLYTIANSNLNTLDVATGTTDGTLVSTDRSNAVTYARGGWYYQFSTNTTDDGYNNRKQVVKVFEEPVAIGNDLYVSAFDSSKAGISGLCGAGVKGETFAHRFCLPYGGCGRTPTNDTFSLGAGIQGLPVGPGEGNDPETRSIVFTNNTKQNDAETNNSLFRYNTPTTLVPQRWYEKYAKPTITGS